jgi:DNA modification methylase
MKCDCGCEFEPVIQYQHRLICGDCTDAAVVARVMDGERIDCIVTDPPYGVDYDGGTTEREKLAGDDSPALYFPALSCWKPYCNDHVALYLWYADGDQAVAQAVAQAGWHVRRNLIWNKNQAQYGALSQQYKQKHEPFLYCHLKGKSPYWAGDATEVTVWDINRASANEDHPTQKPPELFARAIMNSSRPDDIAFDGFAGSGTTGIACHNLGRRARLVEISPAYCAVILERFAGIGVTPELIESAVLEAV